MKIFLGGTCNNSDWRVAYQSAFKKAGYDWFNPVVDDWNADAQIKEEQKKKDCDIYLFTITPKMTGVYSIAEVTESVIINPTKTIFNVITQDDKYQFNQAQLKSLTAIGKLIAKYGGYFCSGLDAVIQVLNFIGSTKNYDNEVSRITSTGISKVINKTLHNSNITEAKKNVKDIKITGNGDMFQLLCKTTSEQEGWMKSTKAMAIGNRCLVQVTTQQKNPDGSYAVAEALTYVPNCEIVDDENSGKKLISSRL